MNIQVPEYQELLVENSLDILAKLREETGMTSAIAMLSERENEGIVLASLTGNGDHCYASKVGSRFQLHCTAPGKALLAAQVEEERACIVSALDYKAFTDKTCSSSLELESILEKDKQQGYSVDVGEHIEGVNCISCCVRNSKGDPLVAVWITGLSIDLKKDQIDGYKRPVMRAAMNMELRLLNLLEDPHFHATVIVEDAKRFIDMHFVNVGSVQKYFEDMNLSYSWFRKLFRDKYGISPMRYRQKLLHQRAQKLILNTHLSIKEIAYQLNYETQFYFSRAFKKQEGVSPLQYRKREAFARLQSSNSKDII